jgi:glutamyl-tRNA synthetase
MDKLLAEKKAYYCFDTPEELTAMRDKAAAEKKSLVYRPPVNWPTKADVEEAKTQGKPVTIRFAMPADEKIVINDIVRGQVSFESRELSDFIIQKSDGFPTYHFAVVVDDELMNVTHVCRGQEHLMNTPYHQALQRALEFRIPQYAHMSITVSDTGGKLSKRERPRALKQAIKAKNDIDMVALAKAGAISLEDLTLFTKGKIVPDMPAIDAMATYLGIKLPEINVVDFLRSGYLPETMVNFLAFLGWNPGDEREIMDVDELIQSYDLSRLNKTNSLFDRKKLMSFNTEHIKLCDKDKLTAHFKRYLNEINSPVAAADDKLLQKLVTINEGARTLEQIDQKSRFIFYPDDNMQYDLKAVKKVLLKGTGMEMLEILKASFEALDDFTEQAVEIMLRDLCEKQSVGLGKVAQPLRIAICGNTVSPPIFDSAVILGKERVLKRIDIAIDKFKDQGPQAC